MHARGAILAQGLDGLSQMALRGGGPALRLLPRPPVPGQQRLVFGTLVDPGRPLSALFADLCRPFVDLWRPLLSTMYTPFDSSCR